MAAQLVGPCAKEDNMEIQAIPPGFESVVKLNRIENNNQATIFRPDDPFELRTVKLETEMCGNNDSSRDTGSLKRKTSLKHRQVVSSSDDESDYEQVKKPLPKWNPEEHRRPDLEESPVFYPSEEEFQDTLSYIATIRAKAEAYGICRIVPPPSWKPPCPLNERNIWEKSKFATRTQRIDKLQNRDSEKNISQINHDKRRKKRKCMKYGADQGNSSETELPVYTENVAETEFGFEPGPDFTLHAFQKYADDFKAKYFMKDNCGNTGQPSLESIEGEYWRIVEKPTEEIEVLYGADLETGKFGSGFPKNPQQVGSTADMKYINSGWNLNNFPKLPGSVLSFENSDITGVLVPWLYVGMCFSSFCWHVEDHYLYSLNYLHWGAPKLWYGVPASDALKLEAAMRKHLPGLFHEQPDLLHKLITQLSPSILRHERVPVYRCVQKPGEFVLTFPRAYHAGFNSGFNCAEAVNVAPVDWLPYGHEAIELYRGQGRKTSISHDKLLFGAAREAVKENWEYNLLRKYTSNNLRWKDVCGKDGILSKSLKTRVEMERTRREFLCKSSPALKMESSFDAISERECSICFFDLHLSAAGCHLCSPEKYACLNHAKQLCSCSWGSKFFLFRYDINELSILVEALEGKLSAVYRWARLDLGLSLSSHISKDSKKVQDSALKEIPISTSPKGQAHSVTTSKYVDDNLSSSQNKEQVDGDVSSTKYINENVKSSQKSDPLVVVLALENGKSQSNSSPQKAKVPKDRFSRKESDTSKKENFASEKPEMKIHGNVDVIVLSDDEEEKPCVESNTYDKHTISSQKEVYPDILANLGKPALKSTVSDPSLVLNEMKNGFQDGKFSIQPSPRKKQTSEDDKRPNIDDTSRKLEPVVKSNNQKGPRMAKIVRRISCNVEPLDFGVVHPGKLWCDSQAIYPKGFKSRVKYIDVIDPTKNTCYYVSEVLDAGRDGPLFMVSVEHTPSEVFIHTSASRCWEMVRERVNHEITKQHQSGKKNLPPFQPPGSLDGLEMFGFSSPAIIQVIEGNDQNRVCSVYWKSRPLNSNLKNESSNEQKTHTGFEKTLDGLFNKANSEELYTLYSLLKNKSSTDEQSLLIQLLSERLQR